MVVYRMNGRIGDTNYTWRLALARNDLGVKMDGRWIVQ